VFECYPSIIRMNLTKKINSLILWIKVTKIFKYCIVTWYWFQSTIQVFLSKNHIFVVFVFKDRTMGELKDKMKNNKWRREWRWMVCKNV